jgi:hypothetical protein
MSKKVDVTYSTEYLKLLSLLSNINEKFLIKKSANGKSIEVESKNAATTVAYVLSTDVENFSFDGDEVGFYKYSEFNELMNAFDSPKLKQEDFKFEIVKDKSKITYRTGQPEAIPKVFEDIKFENPDFTFSLEEEEFSNIRKMIGLMEAETVSFIYSNNKLTVKLAGDDEDNTYEKQFSAEGEGDVSITIPKDIFMLAPKGFYDVEIKGEGIVRFVYKSNPEFKLNLYTAENEDE